MSKQPKTKLLFEMYEHR